MRLYTEEQIKKVIIFLTRNEFAEEIVKNIVSDLTPIELPSEEEIVIGPEWVFGIDRLAYWEGAKWVINHIKQQDNGK